MTALCGIGLRAGALFSGIGGFCMGFHRVGVPTAWAIEMDPFAVTTYKANFPTVRTLQRDVQGVLDKYGAVRPKDADLAIYQLDWSPTLKAAKEKAAKGGRPIFLVLVLNSFGNVCSGHC